MSDDEMPDWEKEFWKRKQQQLKNKQANPEQDPNAFTRPPPSNPDELPHFDPNDLYKQMANQSAEGQPSPDGWKDIDPMTAMFANQDALAARGTGPQTQPVMVKEGATHYRPVDAQNFGTTMPLAKNCGPLSGISGREFEMKGETNVYVIDGMNVVDMENLDPSRTKKLVEVSSPFMGKILVDRSAIVGIQGGGGPQVLND